MSDYSIENERQLIERLVHGKSDAFGFLYAKYKRPMIAFALRYIQSREIAEDMFQEAMMTIWERRETLELERSLAPLLFVIIRNKLFNLMSSMGYEKELQRFMMSRSVDADLSTEMRLEDKDLTELLDRAIESLTPQQKRIFIMSRREYKSHSEIAQELSLSVKTVQIHVSDALRTIKGFLARDAQIYIHILVGILCVLVKCY